MDILQWAGVVAVAAGVAFFLVGIVGLVRFPDALTRLHTVTKADNLGLGLVILGLLPHAETLGDALKLAATWLFAMAAGATAAHLIARSSMAADASSEAP